MKMKDYYSFDDFASDQSGVNQSLISELRKLINETSPELEETVKWGNGCWVNGKLPVVFVHCEDDHTQLGFFGGSQLDDPNNLLRGEAEYVRHVRIESEDDIDEKSLSPIIKQASTYNYKI